MTAKNLGNDAKDSKAKHIQAMRKSVEHKFQKENKKIELKKGSAKVQASKLFSPFELVAAEYLTKMEKERKAEKKREAAEMKKKETEAKRAARTCAVIDCSTYTRKEGGATGWKQCEHCGILFCKKHTTDYGFHVIECTMNNESDEEMPLVQL